MDDRNCVQHRSAGIKWVRHWKEFLFWIHSACLYFLGGFRKNTISCSSNFNCCHFSESFLFLLPFQVKRLEGSFELLLATLLLSWEAQNWQEEQTANLHQVSWRSCSLQSWWAVCCTGNGSRGSEGLKLTCTSSLAGLPPRRHSCGQKPSMSCSPANVS